MKSDEKKNEQEESQLTIRKPSAIGREWQKLILSDEELKRIDELERATAVDAEAPTVRLEAYSQVLLPGAASHRNVGIQTRLKWLRGSSVSLLLRATSKQYYQAIYRGAGRFWFIRRQGDRKKLLATGRIRSLKSKFSFRFEVRDNVFSVHADDQLVFSVLDDSIQSGSPGLKVYSSAADFAEIQVRSTEGETLEDPLPERFAKSTDWMDYRFHSSRLPTATRAVIVDEDTIELDDARVVLMGVAAKDISIEVESILAEEGTQEIWLRATSDRRLGFEFDGKDRIQAFSEEAGVRKPLAETRIDVSPKVGFTWRCTAVGDSAVVHVGDLEVLRLKVPVGSAGGVQLAATKGASRFTRVRVRKADEKAVLPFEAAVDHRYVIPEQNIGKEAVARVRSEFKTRDQRTAAEKTALAGQLLELRRTRDFEPADLYAVVKEASLLACEANDGSLMSKISLVAYGSFKIDPLSYRQSSLALFSRHVRSKPGFEYLLNETKAIVGDALAAQRITDAISVVDASRRATQAKTIGMPFRKPLNNLRDDLVQLQKDADASSPRAMNQWWIRREQSYLDNAIWVTRMWDRSKRTWVEGTESQIVIKDREIELKCAPTGYMTTQFVLKQTLAGDFDIEFDAYGAREFELVHGDGRDQNVVCRIPKEVAWRNLRMRRSGGVITMLVDGKPSKPIYTLNANDSLNGYFSVRLDRGRSARIRNLRVRMKKASVEEGAVVNSLGIKLNRIEPSRFVMGSFRSSSHAIGNELPAHWVTVSRPFYMGVHELRRRHYFEVMDPDRKEISRPDAPMTYVSWNEAVEFCQKLSHLPAEKAAGRVYRLPTEAEWELACRAGSTTRRFFGDGERVVNNYAWGQQNARAYAHGVGRKPPNPLGLYDMLGNAAEMCQDFFGPRYYRKSPPIDPTGPEEGRFRVVRGGNFLSLPQHLRSATRRYMTQDGKATTIGFRLVMTRELSQFDARK